jgi:four helix bundle protein
MSDSPVVFLHNHLEVHRVATEFAVAAWRIAEKIPRGGGVVADQLKRAAVSTVTSIAEGANRAGDGEKRHKFSIARGEVGEAAAALELGAALGLIPAAEAEAARVLAGLVAAMLTQLIKRWGG